MPKPLPYEYFPKINPVFTPITSIIKPKNATEKKANMNFLTATGL
jgi:hypothetical protein